MAETHFSGLSKLAFSAVVLLIVYQLVQFLNLSRKRRAYARSKGALPPRQWPQREQILGYELFKENIRALKDHNFLTTGYDRFQQMGVNTFVVVALGRKIYTTIEPENLKTIQAVDFKKWGLGERRKVAFRPLLGSGIFTEDGAAWAHSRYYAAYLDQ